MNKTIITIGLMLFSLETIAQDFQFKTYNYPYKLPTKLQKACKSNKNKCPQIEIAIANTNYPWLNNILNTHIKKETIKGYLQEATESLYLDHPYIITQEIGFLGQSPRLLEFVKSNYEYVSNAAHGMPTTTYIVIDKETKKALSVVDDILINVQAKKKLEQMVYQQFLAYVKKEISDKNTPEYKEYLDTWKFELTNNFYFNQNKLIFSYDPYQLGPYSLGTIELKLNKKDLKQIIKEEYLNENIKVKQQ